MEKKSRSAPAPARPAGRLERPKTDAGPELEWQRRASDAISQLADRGVPFTSADVVERAGEPPTPSVLPALIRTAHRRGWIAKRRGAVMGSVWIGTAPAQRPPRVGAGRRRDDIRLTDELREAAKTRAAQENVPTGEVILRALRAYLSEKPRRSRPA
jgi:hypothetical protein